MFCEKHSSDDTNIVFGHISAIIFSEGLRRANKSIGYLYGFELTLQKSYNELFVTLCFRGNSHSSDDTGCFGHPEK